MEAKHLRKEVFRACPDLQTSRKSHLSLLSFSTEKLVQTHKNASWQTGLTDWAFCLCKHHENKHSHVPCLPAAIYLICQICYNGLMSIHKVCSMSEMIKILVKKVHFKTSCKVMNTLQEADIDNVEEFTRAESFVFVRSKLEVSFKNWKVKLALGLQSLDRWH